MPSVAQLTIGYAGLGNMGMPGAKHLFAAGANLKVWNRSEGPAIEAQNAGLTRADSLKELAEHA
ncbi:MAG: NAD(P)-binding domain-containing protein, partial [Pirellula sp.]|nr:NAD(P)-binding domain-containing protein [Pirellula sp.]